MLSTFCSNCANKTIQKVFESFYYNKTKYKTLMFRHLCFCHVLSEAIVVPYVQQSHPA